jgi:pimeloyl-[acyl-carrier protein] methyl ester esterase
MDMPIPKLVLLPGLDGTGALFKDFVEALSGSVETEVVRYPTDVFLSYTELMSYVRAVIPISGPYLLLPFGLLQPTRRI